MAIEKSAILPDAGGSNSAAPTVQSGGKPMEVRPECPPDSHGTDDRRPAIGPKCLRNFPILAGKRLVFAPRAAIRRRFSNQRTF
jgi:hypothetical protein